MEGWQHTNPAPPTALSREINQAKTSETKPFNALYQEAMEYKMSELEDIKLIQQEVKQTLDFFVQQNKSNLTDVVGLVAMEWGIEVLRKHFTLEEIAREITKAHNGKHNQ